MTTLRQQLAENLRERMLVTLALNTQVKVHQKSGLAQSTIQRILACDQAATVDVLDDLATCFGVRPAGHFLLSKEESDLLGGFALMDAGDREKLLAYVDIVRQARNVQNARSPLNISREHPAPVEVSAAIARASSRASSSTTNADEHNVTPSTTRVRNKRRQA